MSLFSLSCLITSIASLSLGCFVYFKNRKAFLSKVWFLLSLSIAVWNFGYFKSLVVPSQAQALFWSRYFLYGGAIFIPALFVHFVLSFLGIHEEKRRIIWMAYSVSILFLGFAFTSLLIKGMVPKLSFRYYSEPGVVYPFFLTFFTWCVFYAHYLMFTHYKKLSAYKRNQLKYILLASIVGFGGGATNYPLIYNIPLFPFGHYLVFLYPIIITYAIVTTRLMDITIAVTKTAIFTTVYSIFLGIPPLLLILHRSFFHQHFGVYWWLVPAGVAGCEFLAFIAPTMNHYFQGKAERVLSKERRRYQEKLIALAKQMTLTKDIRQLMVLIVRSVTREIGISHARIYLWDKKDEKYVREVKYGKERRRQFFGDSLSKDARLIQMLYRRRDTGPLLREEVISHFETSEPEHLEEVKARLRSMGTSLLLPAFIGEELIAFLSLGTKRSQEIYTPDDLNMFKILGAQAALAIENALFYRELKEAQAAMVETARLSTVGELATGFAHQIDNPLGIISAGCQLCVMDIKDWLRRGNLPEEDKKVLEKMEDRMGKVIDTAHRAADLVQRIKGYAKPSDRDFEATDLNSVIEDALILAQYHISHGGINVNKNIPQDLPKVKGIGVHLEQALLNMIINGCEAMAGKEGELTISARVAKENPDRLEVTISDNGRGIPKENLNKIFDIFFTTKGPQGTGMGLSMAYRIIKDHNGNINVESKVGEGTKFTVYLPIWQEKT